MEPLLRCDVPRSAKRWSGWGDEIELGKADQYPPDPGAVVEVPDATRPYKHVSAEEKARRLDERKQEENARVERIRLMREYERLDQPAREIRRAQRRGAQLSWWDETNLERWRELRKTLGF